MVSVSKLIRFMLLISLACYTVVMVGLGLLLVSTILTRITHAADYSGAMSAAERAALIEIGAPKVQAMAEAWGSSIVYSYVPRTALDPIVFVSMTLYKKNLLIRGFKSPMLTNVSHDLQLNQDTFTFVTVWRF